MNLRERSAQNSQPRILASLPHWRSKFLQPANWLSARAPLLLYRSDNPLCVCNASIPISPSYFVPGLPTHTTLKRSGAAQSSSKISSTTSPRRKLKFPRRRNPSLEESSTRQGSRFCRLDRLTTRLARRRETRRCERRLITGLLGMLSPTATTGGSPICRELDCREFREPASTQIFFTNNLRRINQYFNAKRDGL
jgi:hypothetical protein